MASEFEPVGRGALPSPVDPSRSTALNSKGRTGEMNKPPALQFYVKDYLASPTRRLFSPRARLAYLELLFYCWDGEATLPNDSETLRKLAECSVSEWKEFGAEIISKFIVTREGLLTHEKQQAQWKEL